MKNLVVSVMVLVFVLLNVNVYASGDFTVTVNGQQVIFTDAQPFLDENGRTMVPLRFVAEALGAKVDWDASQNMVTIGKKTRFGYEKLVLTINSDKVMHYIDDTPSVNKMDTRTIIKDNRAFVPVRLIVTCYDGKIDWDSINKVVKITY